MPMRYHSGYGMHRPMMEQMPREPMYDTHGAHWYTPSPYWDPHSPFMVKDPRYTGHH